MKRILSVTALVLAGALALSGCTSAADRANENLTKSAENFEVPRRIIGINGITDKVLWTVEGFCSYETPDQTVEVICLVNKETDEVERTTMGMADNVTFIVTQMGGKNVSLFRPRVIFRPENIVPDFDLATSAKS